VEGGWALLVAPTVAASHHCCLLPRLLLPAAPHHCHASHLLISLVQEAPKLQTHNNQAALPAMIRVSGIPNMSMTKVQCFTVSIGGVEHTAHYWYIRILFFLLSALCPLCSAMLSALHCPLSALRSPEVCARPSILCTLRSALFPLRFTAAPHFAGGKTTDQSKANRD